MSTICVCDSGLQSLFVGACKGIVDITERGLFFNRFDRNGARNFMDISTVPIPESVITGLLKNPDPTKRFHITPSVMNPALTPNEANNQTFDGGQIAKLSDGTVQLVFSVINVTPQESAKYKQLECGENDLMIVTESGQLIAYASPDDIADEKIYGLPVQNISVLESFMKTNASVPMVTITITFKKSMKTANIITIDAENIGVDMTMVLEPKDAVISIVGNPTTTTVTIKVESLYYGITGFSPIVGLDATTLRFYNVSDATVVAPTTIVETPDGTYAVTYAAQGSGDSMTVEVDPASDVNLISNVEEYLIP